MANFSHKHTYTAKRKILQKHALGHAQIQLRELIFSQRHEIEQRIDLELSQNPALELEEEPDLVEDLEPEEHDDDWDQDYDKPLDEYETGDLFISDEPQTWDEFDIAANLEQAAINRCTGEQERLQQALEHIDYYRVHGSLPHGADPQLHKDLAELERSISYQTSPSVHPIFKVVVDGDRVEAYAFDEGQNLRVMKGFRTHSSEAKKFIEHYHERNRFLNELAHNLLEKLQGDFFRQDDFEKALRHLIPVPPGSLDKLQINSPFTLDKRSLSRLGDHLVLCHFGSYPLNFFLQEKAPLVRLWVRCARKEGITTRKAQLEWIGNQIEERVGTWDSKDVRHSFIGPMRKITEDDIRNAARLFK
jgi:hypothetical protein